MTDDFYVIFGDFFGWDWGTPTILRPNPNKITVLNGCGFGFKKLGLGQPPLLLVVCRAPLSCTSFCTAFKSDQRKMNVSARVFGC